MSQTAARRPSVSTNIDSFEIAEAENKQTMFESERTPSSSTGGLKFNPLQNVPVLGKISETVNSMKRRASLTGLEQSPRHSKDYTNNTSDWAAQAEQAFYASSNRVTEDDMEDRLDQEARASGFEYTPENCMQTVFILLDEPASGLIAGIIGKTIMAMIVVSSFCLIIETHPPMGPCADPDKAATWGYASPERCCEDWDTTVPEAKKTVETFHLIEGIVIIAFTVEYGLRVLLCKFRPRRNRSFMVYVMKPLNIIDFISVAPWWFEIAFGGNSGLGVVRLARLARVFRLLKAGTFLQELQLFVWGYYRAREGLLLLVFLLFMYLACFGSILFLLEYNSQSESCFTEAGFPECWGNDDDLDKLVVQWSTIIEFGEGCDHCDGNLWNCTFAPVAGPTEVRQVDRLGDCIGDNETVGEMFPCDPFQPHYSDSECRDCSEVEWPGKEPMRCTIRPFTSIPITTYFIMATMTTVGYGEHYPGTTHGKIACGACMIAGIMVLALPMVIIGQAFEETIREEKTIALERERRLKIMLLDREQKARREMAASESTEEAVERGELEERLTTDIIKLDEKKAEREKYDIDSARFLLINLMENLGELTFDDRFKEASELLKKDVDEV